MAENNEIFLDEYLPAELVAYREELDQRAHGLAETEPAPELSRTERLWLFTERHKVVVSIGEAAVGAAAGLVTSAFTVRALRGRHAH